MSFNNHIELRTAENLVTGVGTEFVTHSIIIIIIIITQQLNKLNTGYEEQTTKTKISHLLYMDNLKLIDTSEEELQKQIQTVKNLVMIFIWNLDLTNVLRLHLREAN